NANHELMQNGTGLYGDPSSTQSAIIIPVPGDDIRYIVFTADANALPDGLNYSIVDMSLDNGLGAVLSNKKNILLETPIAEKLTAAYHSNNEDIWVIAHKMESNEFLAYLVTNDGVNTNPIISAVGDNHVGGPLGNGAIGAIKISPDGKKLACAKLSFESGLELFDFDTSTGEVSNAKKIHSLRSEEHTSEL